MNITLIHNIYTKYYTKKLFVLIIINIVSFIARKQLISQLDESSLDGGKRGERNLLITSTTWNRWKKAERIFAFQKQRDKT